jgi:hypothetical protein
MLLCQPFNLGISASQAKANLQEEEIGSRGGMMEWKNKEPEGREVLTLPWTSTTPCIALKAANCCIKLQ